MARPGESRNTSLAIHVTSDRLAYATCDERPPHAEERGGISDPRLDLAGGSRSCATAAPFPIPDSWEWVRLGEMCAFVGGITPPKELLTDNLDGIPYFKVAEMNLPGNEKYLQNTKYRLAANAPIKCFPPMTIVFPKNGGALLTNKKRILPQKSICDLNTGGLILHDERMLDYIYCWFSSIDLRDYLSGGVIPTINASLFRTTFIPLPPLAEQKRIVAKVEEMFEVIRSLKDRSQS